MPATKTEQFSKDQMLTRQVVSSLHEPLFATDLDGNIIYWNTAAEALYQYRADEVLDNKADIILEPDDRSAAAQRLREVHEKGSLKSTHKKIRRDGSDFWCESVISLMRDHEGRPTGYMYVDRDVTNRVLLEEAVREYARRCAEPDENAPCMYATIDTDTGRILSCNNTMANALGLSKEELETLKVFDLRHPDCIKEAAEVQREFLAKGEVSDAELQFKRADGSKVDVTLNITALRDEDGKILRSRTCLRDVTKRKKMEQELRDLNATLEQRVQERTAELQEEVKRRLQMEHRAQEAELEYRTIADFTYDWEWWHIPDETFRYVSPACKRVSGYDPKEFIDDPGLLRRVILPEDLGRWDEHHRQALEDTALLEAQFRIRCKDGEIRWIEHACQKVTGEDGEFLGFRASNRDITERKRVEASLRDALEQVAKLKEQLEAENVYLKETADFPGENGELVGRSPVWLRAMQGVSHVAPTDTSVLLLGETGTGKTRVAHLIHSHSSRRDRPLVKINCAALPSSLIESELFGHEKGAFTGAAERRIGRFEVADGGTAFLDEVGDLSGEVQAKLLRVLDDGEFERLGSTETIKVDVRIIAATNHDLERAVADGTFREDLYYRIGVFPITLPSLRERREDIPLLTWVFVTKYQGILKKKIDKIPQETMDFLTSYDWPGNVRELDNVIERAMILSPGNTLRLDRPAATMTPPRQYEQHRVPPQRLDQLERAHIVSVLEQCDWRVKGAGNAAEQLGLKASTLFARMKKHGIRRPGAKRGL